MLSKFTRLLWSVFFYSILLLSANFTFGKTERDLVDLLASYSIVPEKIVTHLYALSNSTEENKQTDLFDDCNLLFKSFPALKNKIAYRKLGNLPTPIINCQKIASRLGLTHFYIKHDGLTGGEKANEKLFGGNKVRKLEFLLADALAHNATGVITFGCAGSNHALATAAYAQALGLTCYCVLKPQWNSHIVQRNLLLHTHYNSQLYYVPSNMIRALVTNYLFFNHKQEQGRFPYIIPTGGSCPVGILGYINAAFELKEQIKAGILPEPDRIYVPLGSAGTLVGLMIGIQAAKLKSRIIPVTVEPEEPGFEFMPTIIKLFKETVAMIKKHDATFPDLHSDDQHLRVLYDFCGKDYALFTAEAVSAIKLLQETENIALDGVYTGKAFAGLLHDLQANQPKDNEPILFWNTFCSDDFNEITARSQFSSLPVSFQSYFNDPVQPLDQREMQ